jgi:hypothetical protein
VQPRSAWTLSEITPETAKPAPSAAHIGARHAGTAVLVPDPDAQPAEPLDRSRREPRSAIDGAQHAISSPITAPATLVSSRARAPADMQLLHRLGTRYRYRVHVFASWSDRNHACRCAFRSCAPLLSRYKANLHARLSEQVDHRRFLRTSGCAEFPLPETAPKKDIISRSRHPRMCRARPRPDFGSSLNSLPNYDLVSDTHAKHVGISNAR